MSTLPFVGFDPDARHYKEEVEKTVSCAKTRLSTLYKHDEAAPDEGYWPLAYMNSYGITISGGSNEIQRNILGERVLGMPKTK